MKRIKTQIYNSCDVSVNDFISDKQWKVHFKLFQDALSKCIKEMGIDRKGYSFYEIESSNNYYEPVQVLIVSRTYPFSRQRVDLSKWWQDYKFLEDKKPFDAVTNDEFDISNYDVTYKDFIHGEYKMESKFYEDDITRSFNSIGIKKSYEMSLAPTFQYRVNNKIYG